MQPSVYLETSFLSYVTARDATDIKIQAHIQVSREWWHHRRNRYYLYVSQIVVDECRAGHPEGMARRAGVVADLPILPTIPQVKELAASLVAKGAIPAKVESDAGHIAHAAVHGCTYLLTWNFKHILNIDRSNAICEIIKQYGF